MSTSSSASLHRAGAALLAAVIGLPTLPARADTFVDAAHSTVNIDYKQFDDAYGLSLMAAADVLPRLNLFANYNGTDFRPSGPELGRYDVADDWTSAGARFTLLSLPLVDLAAGASLLSVALDGERKYGEGVHLAATLAPLPWLRLDAEVGYIDLVIPDVASSATLSLLVTPFLAFCARVNDHADWDFTSYEFGVRWYFSK